MTDPNRALQAMLQAGATGAVSFPPNSRYSGIETAKYVTADGHQIAYLRRRFVPPREDFTVIQEHTVSQGDRLDNIAAKYLGDPEQFWRICDANGAIQPEELTETPGSKVNIALPHGISGPSNA
jgi:nucleoid-associated protein YgaU